MDGYLAKLKYYKALMTGGTFGGEVTRDIPKITILPVVNKLKEYAEVLKRCGFTFSDTEVAFPRHLSYAMTRYITRDSVQGHSIGYTLRKIEHTLQIKHSHEILKVTEYFDREGVDVSLSINSRYDWREVFEGGRLIDLGGGYIRRNKPVSVDLVDRCTGDILYKVPATPQTLRLLLKEWNISKPADFSSLLGEWFAPDSCRWLSREQLATLTGLLHDHPPLKFRWHNLMVDHRGALASSQDQYAVVEITSERITLKTTAESELVIVDPDSLKQVLSPGYLHDIKNVNSALA